MQLCTNFVLVITTVKAITANIIFITATIAMTTNVEKLIDVADITVLKGITAIMIPTTSMIITAIRGRSFMTSATLGEGGLTNF